MLLSCSKTKLRLVLCRNKYGEYFGITVAGYPEAHPDAIVSDAAEMDKIYWNDLHYLKEKVVTQQTSHGDARMLVLRHVLTLGYLFDYVFNNPLTNPVTTLDHEQAEPCPQASASRHIAY